jgi:hypothetical protein
MVVNDHELRRVRTPADDGDTQPKRTIGHAFVSLRKILAAPSSSRWLSMNGTVRPSLLGILLLQRVFNDMLRTSVMKATTDTTFRLRSRCE